MGRAHLRCEVSNSNLAVKGFAPYPKFCYLCVAKFLIMDIKKFKERAETMRSRLDVVRNNNQFWSNDFVAFGEAFPGLRDLEREFELLVYAFDKDIPFLAEMGNFLRRADQNFCTMGEEKDEEFFGKFRYFIDLFIDFLELKS